jgi:hypothetical protein
MATRTPFGAKRRPSWLESLGRGLGSGVTFGLADDAVALVNPELAARMRAEADAARAANPEAFGGGELASMLVPIGGLGLAGMLKLSGGAKRFKPRVFDPNAKPRPRSASAPVRDEPRAPAPRRERDPPVYGSNEWVGRSPYRRADPMGEVRERQAMRAALMRLRADRARTVDADEIADIDDQIAALRRVLRLD